MNDKNYYSISADETLRCLGSSPGGLDEADAEKRLEEYGYNVLAKGEKGTSLMLLLDQFKNPLIVLLIFAGALSLLMNEAVEAAAIFGIILLNVILGFVQEYRAEKAIEALEKISAPMARVIRGGREKRIPAREVVPGDILLLEAGDIVSADSRIVELSFLQIDEASLTGESVPSKKVTELYPLGTVVADQENMAFRGTVVTYGKGKSVVTSTGMNTEFGKIAASLQSTQEVQTPLQAKFLQLTKQLGVVAIVLNILVLVTGILHGIPIASMLLLALTLTVSTIPNSLPVIVTISLSLGARRLAKKNMLIRKLPAAESLGAVTVICSDKTGTITKNQMTITDVFYDNREIRVSGTGYEPLGDFHAGSERFDPNDLELLLRIGFLCNNSKLDKKDGKYEIIGDPTEGSLVVLAKKAGIEDDYFRGNFHILVELPFDSDRKIMSVVYRNEINKKTEAYVKGAPDLLLKACDRIFEDGKPRKLTEKDREKIVWMNEYYAGKALRVLALAYREVPPHEKYDIDSVEKDLVFVGLAGMIDPPRDEVEKAVQQCHDAGINVMIITGDHAVTTKAVAREIGLFKEGDLILSGDLVEKMSDAELEEKIDHVRIVARALPIQKSRIVDALQKKGHIVAMTGDGVNDAPALKKADIGIAMGITGTDVAKEVSKATLVDDNFATIVNAIEEGRNIYNKMIKSARYLLSCNAGEISSVLIALFLNFPVPLLPLQILLMNLLTDDFPSLGLGFETSDDNIMKRPPRNPKEKPISRRMFFLIVAFGLIMGLATLFMFMQYKDGNIEKAQTVAFTTLVMIEMFAVMSSRTLDHSLKHLNPFTNPWLLGGVCLSLGIQALVIYLPPLQVIFGTVPLEAIDWVKIIGLSSMGFVLMEISKGLIKS
ncbi:MAG: cation-translocating P-type ATPase [Candidatus Altiarchaeia archaeon]